MCLKELTLIKPMNHVNVLFVIIITFYTILYYFVLSFYISILYYYFYYRFHPSVYDGCHNLIQKAISFNEVAFVSVKGYDNRIHFCYITKDEAINIMNNTNSS